jgi:hypothetical protein
MKNINKVAVLYTLVFVLGLVQGAADWTFFMIQNGGQWKAFGPFWGYVDVAFACMGLRGIIQEIKSSLHVEVLKV